MPATYQMSLLRRLTRTLTRAKARRRPAAGHPAAHPLLVSADVEATPPLDVFLIGMAVTPGEDGLLS